MALVINTNTMSLNAQRNLTTSASQLATSLQRLSSGLRINSAKDDAAGLAISNRFTPRRSAASTRRRVMRTTASRWRRPRKARSAS